jgi:beta-lactamase class D
MYKTLLLLFFNCFSIISTAQTNKSIDLKSIFAEYQTEGCFVLFDETKNTYYKYNSNLCDSTYLPASTFKIPNALIALEEGIVKDTNQIFKWDGTEYMNPNWNKDQNLHSSMKVSCVWVYFNFAKQIGIPKYNEYLQKFNYGNQNTNGNQQVDFLGKFYNHQLKTSTKSIDIIKDMIVIENTAKYKLSGKTGCGDLVALNQFIMWHIGYLEVNHKVYYYALNFVTPNSYTNFASRLEITKKALKQLKLIE